MPSLRQNLKWFFLLIALIGTGLLCWGLYGQWRVIGERHEIRQRSQIATLASATETMMASQEMVLDLLGRQLLDGGLAEQPEAARALLDRMVEINPTVAGYALATPAGEFVLADTRAVAVLPSGRIEIRPETFVDTLAVNRMVIGRPFFSSVLDGWVVPVCKAMRDPGGGVTGVVTATIHLDGPHPFVASQSFLGPRNTVQIVRGRDLFPLYWAAAIPRPAGYYTAPIPREYYDRAIASAQRRTGMHIDAIKAGGEPVPYRVVNALGPHFGMAEYNPRYDYWVLTQTHRDQLLGEFGRAAVVYVAVYAVLLAGILFVLHLISRAEHVRRRELVHRANHDTLTELPNRQRMRLDFERMRRENDSRLALLFIDMDNFKAVNDGFGHVQGDKLLRQLGARLSAFATDAERVARIGGDEFVLLTPETDERRLLARSHELIGRLAAPYSLDDFRCELGCSVGIARVPDAGESLDDVLRAADVAMYAAKKQRNAARLWEPSLGWRYLENIQIEQRLRVAIEQQGIEMVYQPQVDTDGQVVGVEALARWNDPELGAITPRRFVEIAEVAGLISRLGDYIVRRCLSDAVEWQVFIDRPLRLAINVSVTQFLQPDFAPHLVEQVSRAGLGDTQIVLEITESLFMEDQARILAVLHQLRDAGIRIALDDFGTGFSSLSLLRTLPVDELKIDKSFIDGLERDRNSRKLTQSIIGIGRNHGMLTMAEGVETRRQFEILREDGCDGFQGYLFARPMALSALREYLSAAPRSSTAPAQRNPTDT